MLSSTLDFIISRPVKRYFVSKFCLLVLLIFTVSSRYDVCVYMCGSVRAFLGVGGCLLGEGGGWPTKSILLLLLKIGSSYISNHKPVLFI